MNITWARRRAKKIVRWSEDNLGGFIWWIWYVFLFLLIAWATFQQD